MQILKTPKPPSGTSSRPDIDSVLLALRFDAPQPDALRSIPEKRWARLLEQTDRTHLTLALGCRAMPHLPTSVQERIHRDLENNALRHRRFQETYAGLHHQLARHGVDFVFLKGRTHTPYYTNDLRTRPQYDIDLYCPPEHSAAALGAVTALGFEPFAARTPDRVDHLPTLIRKTGWQWRGDYYDPGLPPAVEIHFRFWDPQTEGFSAEGTSAFWARRIKADAALHPADRLTYAALHLVRHLVRGDLRLHHAYELAHFLTHSRQDIEFWQTWIALTPLSLRRIVAIACRFAEILFGAAAPQGLAETFAPPVAAWFHLFAFSPVAALEHPNKDDLLLHLALVEDPAARRRIALRRLLPPPPAPAILHPHTRHPGLRLRLLRRLYRLHHLASRACRHAAALPPLALSAARWWWALRRTAATGHTLPAGTGPA